MSKSAIGIITSVVTAMSISLIMWFFGAFSDGQTAISEAKIRKIANEEISAAGTASASDVAANAESIKDLEGVTVRVQDKIERIVDILLEE